MANHHPLTKRVDHVQYAADMVTEGVSAAYSINHEKVVFSGAVWDAMDGAAQTAEIAMAASAETAHAPTTITEVTLTAAPHVDKFHEECLAVAGVTRLTVELPESYSGTAYLEHNVLTSGEQAALVTAAEAHDATTVPSLILDVSDLQVLGNGVTDGTITVTDSRGAVAEGVVVDVIPPPQSIALDKTSITLDALGKGTLKFGPSPAAGYVSGKMPIGFRYNGAGVIGDGADATVQYT